MESPHRHCLARCDGHDGVGRDAPPVEAHGGRSHHGHVDRGGEAQGWAPGRGLEGGGSFVVSHKAVGRPQREGIGGAGPGYPQSSHPQPTAVLDKGQKTGVLDHHGAPRVRPQRRARC